MNKPEFAIALPFVDLKDGSSIGSNEENPMKIKFTALLSLCLCLVSISKVYAQQINISGIVQDSDKQPLEYSEIALYKKADSILVKRALSDVSGKFTVTAAPGEYTLKINYPGKVFFYKNISVSQNINLGIIQIENKSKELREVVVSGKKKLIERKIDRLVFNVENSIASQGMDATEALNNTPMVRVDKNNGISIVGKSGVSVMVNERMINLSGSELVNYLQSLRSDNISKIEVITTPPAKYEAQGNSGIINIVLKKNPNLGWSGNLSSTYVRKSLNGYLNNAVFNYQSSRLSASLKLRHYDREKKSIERTSVESQNSIFSVDNRVDMNDGLGANFSLDYKLTDKSKIGVIYDFGRGHVNMDINNSSIYKTGQTPDSLLTTYAEHRYKIPANMLNLYYDLKLDSTGKTLSISGNYFSNIQENGINFKTLNTNSLQSTTIRNYSKIDYNIWSGQADLTLPYKWAKLETGAKYTLFKNSSDIQYFNFLNNDYVINPANSNLFDYKEQNLAGYISLEKDFNEKWSAKAGLRYEYSIIEGILPATQTKTKNNYGKLFPSMYVSYTPDKDNVFSANYSRRINRPFFRALNPYRWYSNTYTYAEGNPLLQPSYNDNVELGYSYKNTLSFTLYNQYGRNNYGQVVEFDNGYKITSYQNYYNENNTGLTINYFDTFFKIWETSINVNAYYTKTKGLLPQIVGQESFSVYYTINNTISLNKSKTLYLLMNFWQTFPYNKGNSLIKGSYEFAPGVKMSFLDKKLQFSAIANDVFKSDRGRGYTTYSNSITTFDNYYDARTLTLSLTYNFGNNKVKGANKSIRFDEKNRAN